MKNVKLKLEYEIEVPDNWDFKDLSEQNDDNPATIEINNKLQYGIDVNILKWEKGNLQTWVGRQLNLENEEESLLSNELDCIWSDVKYCRISAIINDEPNKEKILDESV